MYLIAKRYFLETWNEVVVAGNNGNSARIGNGNEDCDATIARSFDRYGQNGTIPSNVEGKR